MISITSGPDGLPQVVAQLSGVAVYLDNWAKLGDHRIGKRWP